LIFELEKIAPLVLEGNLLSKGEKSCLVRPPLRIERRSGLQKNLKKVPRSQLPPRNKFIKYSNGVSLGHPVAVKVMVNLSMQ